MKILLALILSNLLIFSSPGWNADYAKGYAAAQSGDFETALREWLPLAEQSAAAQNNLGEMYGIGRGVPQDDKTAVKWFSLAAEQGDVAAQFNLALMYADGRGVSRDHKTAIKWYTLAAEQGFAEAQHNLGMSYFKGEGVIKDSVYAYMWFNIAASNGVNEGTEARDLIANNMTPSQAEKTQDLARKCVAKNYKDC